MRRAGVLALALAGALAGCAGGTGSSGAPRDAVPVQVNGQAGWHGTPVRTGYSLPTQTFTDTRGRSVVPAQDVPAPVTLAFFGYTHCPDVCNVVLANLALARRGLPAERREAVQVLFIGTDPARDTPRVMRRYLDRFDASFEGLVAPVDTVAAAAKQLHISYEKPDGSRSGDNAGYLVDHGTYTTAFVDGRARLVWNETTPVGEIRADLRRLVRLASSSS